MIGGGSTGPDQHKVALEKLEFKCKYHNANISKMREHIKSGKPFILHGPSHYIAVCDYDNEGNYFYVNSTVNSSYGHLTGWHSESILKDDSTRQISRNGVMIELNWTITEQEKQKFNHFYSSMGGAWNSPHTHEKIATTGYQYTDGGAQWLKTFLYPPNY